jgi:ribonuclease P protein component
MLAAAFRLPASDIPGVIRRGKRIFSETIQIIVQKGVSDVSRFAFIVSTKTDKRATRRNRMKRTLSESISHTLPRLHTVTDGVVIARKNFSDTLQTEVEGEILELFKKAGIIA